MDEKVYRQRRNLMILCIGIILFYMGPGDFNEIGLLKNLGLHTLEAWKLKAMVLVMYLYYAWRYYQYSYKNHSEFFCSIREYLMEKGRLKTNLRIYPKAVIETKRHNRKYNSEYEIKGIYSDVCMMGLLSDWEFVYECRPEKGSNKTNDNKPQMIYPCKGMNWIWFKLKIIFAAGFKLPGFTDWIMPWLIFWGTYTMIIYHEVITPATQLTAL